jgi:alkaline phosphatase
MFQRFLTLKVTILLLLAISLMMACQHQSSRTATVTISTTKPYPKVADTEVRNIILMIGDGMGLAQMNAARIYRYGADGFLHIERMPFTGLLHTHSADNLITDSAAGATALAAGVKTKNGMIGMTPDTLTAVTILEKAREIGKSTGLVSTSSITHATPACFAAHIDYRRKETAIAEQLVASGTDVMLGAGTYFFLPKDSTGSKREDNRNLLAEAQKAGYDVIRTREALAATRAPKVLGLFAPDYLKNEQPEPSLAELTARAIELLNRNKKGFFLMVEGSQIDWAAHDNKIDYMIKEMISFDDAVQKALDFAAKDQHTLVIVTADHETGGLTIEGGDVKGGKVDVDWTTTHHTGVPVGIFAFGPYASHFTGVRDNTDVPKIFAELWGIDNFPDVKAN